MARRFNKVKEKHQFKQNTDLVIMLVNKEFEDITTSHPLEHYNTYDDHITIRDHTIGRYIDIWPKDGELWCELCEKISCRHIRFVTSLPQIMEKLEKRGWKV